MTLSPVCRAMMCAILCAMTNAHVRDIVTDKTEGNTLGDALTGVPGHDVRHLVCDDKRQLVV